RHDYSGRTDCKFITNMDRVLQQPIECEVFPKDAHWQLAVRQLPFPVVVVNDWIAVNRLEFSTVDTEVGLTVSVQIKLTQCDTSLHRLLKDARSHTLPMPDHFARKPGIYRQQLHLPLFLMHHFQTPAPASFLQYH